MKDLVALAIILAIFAAIVGFIPNYLGHPDNYIEADPLVTPAHIVPEWYLLPFYAILRAFTADVLIDSIHFIHIRGNNRRKIFWSSRYVWCNCSYGACAMA